MTVYRLEPIPGTEASLHWKASTIEPMKVWVEAETEAEAREKVTSATIVATKRDPNKEVPLPPWKDFGLTWCIEDSSRRVGECEVTTEGGQSLSTVHWSDLAGKDPWV